MGNLKTALALSASLLALPLLAVDHDSTRRPLESGRIPRPSAGPADKAPDEYSFVTTTSAEGFAERLTALGQRVNRLQLTQTQETQLLLQNDAATRSAQIRVKKQLLEAVETELNTLYDEIGRNPQAAKQLGPQATTITANVERAKATLDRLATESERLAGLSGAALQRARRELQNRVDQGGQTPRTRLSQGPTPEQLERMERDAGQTLGGARPAPPRVTPAPAPTPRPEGPSIGADNRGAFERAEARRGALIDRLTAELVRRGRHPDIARDAAEDAVRNSKAQTADDVENHEDRRLDARAPVEEDDFYRTLEEIAIRRAEAIAANRANRGSINGRGK